MISRDRIDLAIAYVDERIKEFGEDEATAIAWVVVLHRIPYREFIPAYLEIKGSVPEVHQRFLLPEEKYD